MLLLRAVLAAILLWQSGCYLSDPASSAPSWVVGIVGMVSGALLLVGFLTPVAGVIVGLCAAGVGFSLIPGCTTTLFPSLVPVMLAVTVLLAVIILGPGAFSVDARVFGRREIIIPPSPQRR